jgi:hypothetical protein
VFLCPDYSHITLYHCITIPYISQTRAALQDLIDGQGRSPHAGPIVRLECLSAVPLANCKHVCVVQATLSSPPRGLDWTRDDLILLLPSDAAQENVSLSRAFTSKHHLAFIQSVPTLITAEGKTERTCYTMKILIRTGSQHELLFDRPYTAYKVMSVASTVREYCAISRFFPGLFLTQDCHNLTRI